MLTKRFYLALLSLVFLVGAGSGNFLNLHYSHYNDANTVWSYTPGLDLRLWASPAWRVDWSRELDGVSGASRVASLGVDGITTASPHDVPNLYDGITGASTVEFRSADQFSVHYDNAGTVVGGGLYVGSENDYRSLSPSVDVAVDVAGRNATLAANYAWFYDHWTELAAGEKQIHSVGISYTQTLTRLTLAQLGGNWIRSKGYLGRPWNPVAVMGDYGYEYYDEVLPGRKTALALNATVIQGWKWPGPRRLLGSLNLSYRRYQDSWALSSHTVEARISQHLTPDLYVRLRGRYYRQTGTDFAQDTYAGDENYRTADMKYFPFSSFLAGIKFGGAFPDSWIEANLLVPDSWDLKADWLIRNTQGNPLRYQFFATDQYYTQTTLMGAVQYDF
jgi:hypothetical protein